MKNLDRLISRVRAGETVVIDGATGTECERRGVPKLDNAWNGGAALSQPGVVREVHSDYLAAGAQLIIANTFATHKHVLEAAGVADDFVAYNRRGVELAVQARAAAGTDEVVVAAGISNWTWAGEHPTLDVLRRNSAEQAAAMKDGGAELLVLEMMIDIDRMTATLEGARTSGLPIWVGFTCGLEPGSSLPDDGVARLRDGEPLADAIRTLDGYDIGAITIMHTDVELIDGCLDVALDVWPGVVGVYAHSGAYTGGDWVFDRVISPGDYRSYAQRWSDRGVRVIGGCCGIGPDHIRALASLVQPPQPEHGDS